MMPGFISWQVKVAMKIKEVVYEGVKRVIESVECGILFDFMENKTYVFLIVSCQGLTP